MGLSALFERKARAWRWVCTRGAQRAVSGNRRFRQAPWAGAAQKAVIASILASLSVAR